MHSFLRNTFFFLLSACSVQLAQGQHVVALKNDISLKQSSATRTAKIAQVIDTLSLPFVEDFAKTEGDVPDTSLFYQNGGCYVNNRLCFEPPSLRVATFDGLRQNGEPYDFSDVLVSHGLADQLSGKPLNLQGLTSADSVIFSFYWQKGGLHPENAPDEGDSLVLEFYDSTSTWNTIWDVNGDASITPTSTNPFTLVHIPIDSGKYLYKGFRFRFRSYVKLSGRYDVFHVDYIYIDKGRSMNDRIEDFAFSTPHGSFLTPYTSMPPDHYFADPAKYTAIQRTSKIFNLSDSTNILAPDNTFLRDTIRDMNINPMTFTSAGAFLAPGQAFEQTWNVDNTNMSSVNDGNDIVLEHTFKAVTPDTIPHNDSITEYTTFSDYFAYDDGSAELGAGITKQNGLIAVAYDLEIQDTLRFIQAHFPKFSPDQSEETLDFKVWTSLKGIDGATSTELIYSGSGTIKYKEEDANDGLNRFVRYPENDLGILDPSQNEIILPAGRFYIGFQQFTSTIVPVGFDVNTSSESKIYRNLNLGWENFFDTGDTTTGSIMMRPVFGFSALLTSNNDKVRVSEREILLFPNPGRTHINITGDSFENYSILDLSGRELTHGDIETSAIDISNLRTGIYLVRLFEKGYVITKRFTKL